MANSRKLVLILVMAALQMGDLASTHYAFARGAFEANPLLTDWSGIVAAKLFSIPLFALLVWRSQTKVGTYLCGLWAVIVVSNATCR